MTVRIGSSPPEQDDVGKENGWITSIRDAPSAGTPLEVKGCGLVMKSGESSPLAAVERSEFNTLILRRVNDVNLYSHALIQQVISFHT